MKTKITELLQIEVPIIQGGMAWVAEHHLAAAVSAAGGLGIIGAANAPADWVRGEIRKARELTDRPIGVNVMLLSPYADEVAQVLVEEKVPVITTGAGNPGKYMEMWKESKSKVIPVVASVALARMMERGGADAVIAEGRPYRGCHHHDAGASGGRCSKDSGDCSRRYWRWKRHCGSLYAGGSGSSDWNPVCGGRGIHLSPQLQRADYQSKRH